MRFRLVLLACCAALVAGCSNSPAPREPDQDQVAAAIAELPDLVRDVLDRTKVPGMAVAVVHDGQTVYAEGFGVRALGQDAPVDADTVFPVASVSKSIGATVVATQVAAGVLDWDDPVAQYLPGFDLADPYVTANATVGDFYAHRTGLPHEAGDLLESIGFDRDEILARLDQFPLGPFRTSYAYANFGTTTGGAAAAAAAGTDWETLSQDALYGPLGMDSTSSRHADLVARPNRALQHAKTPDGFAQLYERDADPQSPAGGVSSTVNDLARWMAMVLASGEADGQEVASAQALLPAVTPQAVSNRATELAAHSGQYGYGFNVGTHASGPVLLSHSGAFLLGTATAFTLVPSLDLGIVVLTNAAPVGAAEAVTAGFTDLALTGEVSRDWVELLGPIFADMSAPLGDLAGAAPPAAPAPPRDLADYAGDYQSPLYGTFTVTVEGGALRGALGPERAYTFDLDPWDGDTFAFTPTGENAPDGSRSSAVFDLDAGTVVMDFFNRDGLGTWRR